MQYAMTLSFADWLQAELDERKLKPADLSRIADISTGSISDIFSGRRPVGKSIALKIAKGLELPPDQVFRAAGLLPPEKKRNEIIEQIIHEVQDRSADEQKEFLSYIRWQNNQRKRNK